MEIKKLQSGHNTYFGAKFINKAENPNIDTQKAGEIFEKLTKDSPDEKLILEKNKMRNEGVDVFVLTDKNNNKLARVACSFTTHSEFDETPEKQAYLLNNIFKFIQRRANENTAFKKLEEKITKLHNQQDLLLKIKDQNIVKDAQKYNIEVEEVPSDDPHFKKAYQAAQFNLIF